MAQHIQSFRICDPTAPPVKSGDKIVQIMNVRMHHWGAPEPLGTDRIRIGPLLARHAAERPGPTLWRIRCQRPSGLVDLAHPPKFALPPSAPPARLPTVPPPGCGRSIPPPCRVPPARPCP